MRKLRDFAVVGLLAVAAFLLYPMLDTRPETAHEEASEPQKTQSYEDGTDAPVSTLGGEASIADRTPATSSPTLLSLQGGVLITDRDGDHRPSRRGFIRWRLHGSTGDPEERMSGVIDDRWALEAPSDVVLEPVEVMWSGTPTSHHATPVREKIPAPAANGYTVRATLDYGFVLNVLDAETLEHVRAARLVLAVACDTWSGDIEHPPEEFRARGLAQSGDSPLLLPHLPGTRVGWAWAPGYRWRRFAYSGMDGELTVPLHRGTDVDVVVTGVPPEFPNPRLHVFSLASGDSRAGRVPAVDAAIPASGSLRLTGLASGTTEFVVVPYPRISSAGERLGEIRVELRPSAHQEVVLDVASPAATSTYGAIEVVLRNARERRGRIGRVEIHARGTKDQPPLEAYLAEGAVDEDGSLRRRFRSLRAGEYAVAVLPAGGAQVLAVRPGEIARAEFDLASGVPVRVHVRDPETGSLLGGDVVVAYRPAQVRHATSWQEVRPRGLDRTYHFECLSGPISLAAWGPGRTATVIDVSISPEGAELELPLPRERLLPIRLRAFQGSCEIPLPAPFWTGMTVSAIPPTTGESADIELGTRQVAALKALDTSHATVYVTRPGRYRIGFESLLGIRAPAPLEVEVLDDSLPEQSLSIVFD